MGRFKALVKVLDGMTLLVELAHIKSVLWIPEVCGRKNRLKLPR